MCRGDRRLGRGRTGRESRHFQVLRTRGNADPRAGQGRGQGAMRVELGAVGSPGVPPGAEKLFAERARVLARSDVAQAGLPGRRGVDLLALQPAEPVPLPGEWLRDAGSLEQPVGQDRARAILRGLAGDVVVRAEEREQQKSARAPVLRRKRRVERAQVRVFVGKVTVAGKGWVRVGGDWVER